MSVKVTRRQFISHLGFATVAVPIIVNSPQTFAAALAASGIKFGYSAITWGGNDVQAIKEISQLGFTGIQLRANTYPEYGQKPAELKKLLDEAKLELAMFSSGNANINTGNDEAEISKHVTHAKFVKALGGKYIQVTNSSRPKNGAPTEEDLVKYGKMLTEVGKRTQPLGIETTYHNHMHQLGETPEEVDVILKNTDPKYVSLLLDVAHYQQGGGDPAKAIRQYKNRLKALHIKDVRDKNAIDPSKPYQFVELGQGRVNFPGIFAALKEVNFKGYAIIELDAVPEKNRTPLESGQITRNYLKNQLKFNI
ncbi:sugar phosphate isomerase/epimerase family protein [Adhaeribacter radiodurans]|uniref:TIM barrel protein n=1 Tax=Adhaeribacter radiodurans TaxID=2745197 RepID=A0A7L7LD02_9BACT|nr:sugar phosphate isomerase/epimerase [Adhaeribacter radiodurans]QMU30637.1 TIM barrel protein [Adhaeribacter radiodurans]